MSTEKIKFKISPEGVAALFCRKKNFDATKQDVDDLVELFKMYYEQGREDQKAEGEMLAYGEWDPCNQ